MHFKLVDGKAVWATHYKDGEYFYEGDDIPEGAEEVEQPSDEIKERAKQLEGITLSKSEFEKYLYKEKKTKNDLEDEIDDVWESHLESEGLI